MLLGGRDTVFRLGLDFPEPCERYIAARDGDDGEESEDHSQGCQPPIDELCAVVQKLASEVVEAALTSDIDFCRNRRSGRWIGLHERVTTHAVLVAHWSGIDFYVLCLCRSEWPLVANNSPFSR